MNHKSHQAFGIFLGLATLLTPLLAADNASRSAPTRDWQLVWSDEFNQPDGSAPDASKWGYDVGGGGWGNDELEFYTARTNNVRIESGHLVIEARKENYSGRHYTSARLLTKDKHSWVFGRIEARMKIPRGQGIWPAFWMLGANINSVSWPTCGEIDIMENIGKEPGTVHGTVHGPGYSGGAGIGGPLTLTGGRTLADDFHVYAIEWETNRICWYLDQQLYFTVTPTNLPAGKQWVYHQPQFLLLNMAVGGQWPGNPDAKTIFPQRMTVDYVRVYQKPTTSSGR
jgi:beta-glucanase (GH16 family)